MLPPTIPIFPLPNVVLFPNVFLPLHIFEPRYRAMLADALAGDRIIGMTLLQPGLRGRLPGRGRRCIRSGCAGVITHAERLPDGRSNVVLRGLEKFRIVERGREPTAYRVAHVEALPETTSDADKTAAAASSASGSRRCSSPPSSAAAPTRSSRRRSPTRTWSTRWRSTSSSTRSNARRCSSATASWRAADGLIELLEMKTFAPPAGRWGGGSSRGVH